MKRRWSKFRTYLMVITSSPKFFYYIIIKKLTFKSVIIINKIDSKSLLLKIKKGLLYKTDMITYFF